jgi:hypothetical protein
MKYFKKAFNYKIYDVKLHVVITDDLNGALEKFTDLDQEYDAQGIFTANKKDEPLIVLLADKVNADLIAHEALHFVFGVMNTVGLQYCPASEEAFTYLLGLSVGDITTFYDSVKKNFKAKTRRNVKKTTSKEDTSKKEEA